MPNTYFQFKQFTIHQERCAMKVTTDACLFGAWVADAIAGLNMEGKHLLDIGTGTGLLSLMIAQQSPVRIDAVEIDPETASQAAENITGSPWKDRIRVIANDVRSGDEPLLHLYDLIVSNPPFYENELASGDKQKNIAHHDSGLLLRELLQIIGRRLADDGVFYLMLPFKRSEDVTLLAKLYHLVITKIVKVRPSVNHAYSRIFIAGGRERSKNVGSVQEEIAIKDEKGAYTDAFRLLLKDYYLKLGSM